MDDTIELLLKLQEVDTIVAELERKKSLVPKRLAEEQEHLDSAAASVAREKERARHMELEKRAAEKEADEIEQTIVRYQNQLNTAKTNEEYRALLAQIDRAKERRSGLEDRVLASMVDGETVDQSLHAAETALKAAKEHYAERERELAALALKLGEGISGKRAERDRLVTGLDAPTLRKYERILAGKEGLAVAVIEGYVCSGCHGTLPPQTVNEIRKRDRLYTCQFCGRIVVTRS